WSSFHVIGAIFDKVYPGGDPTQAVSGVSTYSVGPGAGAVFDLVIPEPGEYAFVDHDMAHAVIGAQGILDVRREGAPREEKAPSVTAATTSAAPAEKPVPVAPSGPYKFDPAKGASLYAANCAACHQATGAGLPGAFPPLKGNPAVLDPDPTKQIKVVLNGLHGESINGTMYPTVMPPFGGSLNDFEIADIINHERSSWGNQGKPITADQVKALRGKPKD
ncbi:MAG TPA: c-type cytochrome, partial [Oleiagrimonas sp.]|nr:c-type cytochrome [Oleiagrimonas sp.]